MGCDDVDLTNGGSLSELRKDRVIATQAIPEPIMTLDRAALLQCLNCAMYDEIISYGILLVSISSTRIP